GLAMLAQWARATLKSSGLGFKAGRSFFLRSALVKSTILCSSLVIWNFTGSPARDAKHVPRHQSMTQNRIMIRFLASCRVGRVFEAHQLVEYVRLVGWPRRLDQPYTIAADWRQSIWWPAGRAAIVDRWDAA